MKYLSIFLFLTLLLSACSTTKYVNIDIHEPALITFDSTIVNVLVVNNIPNSINGNIKFKTPSDTELAFINDSAKWAFLKSLSTYMNEEKYFGNVEYNNYSLRTDTLYDKDIPLTRDEIAYLCQSTQTDAVISLDQFLVLGSLEKINNGDSYSYTDLLELKIAAKIRTYTADGTKLEPEILTMDSLYWEGQSTVYKVLVPLPPFEKAVLEASRQMADKMVDFFIPHWNTTSRYYYTDNNSEMKKAAKVAKNGNWEAAEKYWTTLFESETDDIKKAKLASNIALANECQNNIENANKWISIAYSYTPKKERKVLRKNITLYNIELNRRLRNKQKLIEQIGN